MHRPHNNLRAPSHAYMPTYMLAAKRLKEQTGQIRSARDARVVPFDRFMLFSAYLAIGFTIKSPYLKFLNGV
jgi:hypothetical protein